MHSAAFKPANPASKPLRELAMRITWAALDLSRVRARLEAARARAEAQLAFYEKTVLEALEEPRAHWVGLRRARARREHLRSCYSIQLVSCAPG